MSELVSARWVLDITALTSIVHSDDSHAHSSNQALFRREKILTPHRRHHQRANHLRQLPARDPAAPW